MPDRYHYAMPLNHIDIGKRASDRVVPTYVVAPTALAMLLAPISFAASDSPQSTAITHSQVQVPRRPAAALFEGTPGRQHTEIHYDQDTQTVTIRMLVQDPQGYFIPNIRRENFAVFEDGQRQRDASVAIERSPVTLAVLLEYGGRYRGLNEALSRELYRAVIPFLDEIGREDRVSIVRYGDRAETLAGFSDGHDTLQRSLLNITEPPPASETNFYDALIDTIARLVPQSGRKGLLIFSSGLDTFSRHGFEDALQAVRQADIPVYVIGLDTVLEHDLSAQRSAGVYAAYDWHRATTELERLARASGGRVYAPDSTFDLAPVFDDLMENLRTRYVITYRSAGDPHSAKERTVRIDLQDSRDGSPLKIIDADGRAVQARISVERRYLPSASAAISSDAARAPDAGETSAAAPGTGSSGLSR